MAELFTSIEFEVWWLIILVVGAVAFFWISNVVALALAKKSEQKTGARIYTAVVTRGRSPIGTLFILAIVQVILPFLPIGARLLGLLDHAVKLGLIATIGWLIIAFLKAFQDVITVRYVIDEPDNLKARRVHTQTKMLRKVATVIVIVITMSLALMTFENIRAIGAGLLASAGAAGLVAGLAARPLVANLIAGIQVAVAEPIRLEDVVIIEGEWGWIEEITTTYVVVRIWDLRRLIVPLSYFFEKPFQNWTRVTADLLGTVFIYVDYTLPVEPLRQELHRVLKDSGMWNEKVWGMQVTNTNERVMELRALMSAPNSGAAWNLRCHVREKLIAYLQENHPQCLPRARVELNKLPGEESDEAADTIGGHPGPAPA
jgi:small-conductance mechanosensitive channel